MTEGYGIVITASDYTDENDTIEVKGCWAFTVRNLGTVKATIFGNIPIAPNQVLPFPNVANMPYAENGKLSFASDAPGSKAVQIIMAMAVKINDKLKCGE